MKRSHFRLERVRGQPVTDAELIADLKRIAAQMGSGTVGQKEYRQLGKYDDSTASRRFGSWNKALVAAGLELSNPSRLTDEQLFENILALWLHYGRQPRRRELAVPPSGISQSPYLRRFGSWGAALESFVRYVDSDTPAAAHKEAGTGGAERRTPRDPDLRLRYKVLKRDRFTCQACGKSPATSADVELHVDHILPWSKGGETVIENLQTLCSRCNLGKGSMFDEAG